MKKHPSAKVLPRSILLTFVAAEDRDFFVRHSLRSPITTYLARMLLGQNYDKMKAPALSLIISTELTIDEILSLYAMEVHIWLGLLWNRGREPCLFRENTARANSVRKCLLGERHKKAYVVPSLAQQRSRVKAPELCFI